MTYGIPLPKMFYGRGLHSSTFLLNLSRFLTLTPPTDTAYSTKVLTLSRKVDECKPLFYGSTATSGLAADCGVSVMDGVVEVGLRCPVFTPRVFDCQVPDLRFRF